MTDCLGNQIEVGSFYIKPQANSGGVDISICLCIGIKDGKQRSKTVEKPTFLSMCCNDKYVRPVSKKTYPITNSMTKVTLETYNRKCIDDFLEDPLVKDFLRSEKLNIL